MVNPIWLIILPLLSAFLIYTISFAGKGFITKSISFVTVVFNAIVSYKLLQTVKEPFSVVIGGFAPPQGINLYIDSFSLFVAVIINVISLLSLFYFLGEHETNPKYDVLFLLLVAGSNGMILTGDIFNLFVFFEITCIASYALVAYEKGTNGIEAAMKYLILGTVGSIMILIAVALIYFSMGTLNMASMAKAFPQIPAAYRLLITLFLFAGLGVEAAIFPLNAWLPDAHSSAPSSISAVLSGFVIEIPLLVMAKIFVTIFDAGYFIHYLAVFGVVTVLVGEISAFRQTNIKRALAYSSMGQVGLILLALSVGSASAESAALLQVLNHAVSKSLLFFVAGFMIKSSGSYSIESFRGIAQKMPLTTLAFTIGSFSLIGVPPLFGFFSKFNLIMSVAKAGSYPLVAFALLGTVIETVYLVRIIQVLYDKSVTYQAEKARSWESIVVAAVLMIFIVVGVALLPQITAYADLGAISFLTKPVIP